MNDMQRYDPRYGHHEVINWGRTQGHSIRFHIPLLLPFKSLAPDKWATEETFFRALKIYILFHLKKKERNILRH